MDGTVVWIHQHSASEVERTALESGFVSYGIYTPDAALCEREKNEIWFSWIDGRQVASKTVKKKAGSSTETSIAGDT